ncbi:uncharacterized protein LOC124293425 [Neodiprion lecontei]|uniref:Uncharacterized protein LOC124293425 n=1 Tax=Neodiprion lecontei TaxID=441921 RepID=A0ABM3FQD8_NEOLC|nr:uncharacterized protein LOC124293425 [Neodiprion lecontei]
MIIRKISVAGEKWLVIGIYVNGDLKEKIGELKEQAEEADERTKVLVGGDFNARTGQEGGGCWGEGEERKKKENEGFIKEAAEARTESKIWEIVNRERKKWKRVNEEIGEHEWREYFMGLLGGVENKVIEGGGTANRKGNGEEELQREEIRKVIGKLRDGKAPGGDGIVSEVWRFPKNLEIRMKWLNACGLTINDDVRRTCICSRHFKTDDVCQSNVFGAVKSSIKRNAVPTLYLTNPLSLDTINKSPPNTPLSELFEDNGVSNQSSSFFSDNNIVDDNNVLNILEKSSDKYLEPDSIEFQTSNNSSINFDDSYKQSDSNEFMENAITNSDNDDKNTVPDENTSPSQCRKRRFFEPRHVSEISELDFATPKRANRTISLIKNTDQKRREKIRQLQRQTRNLERKIKSLKDLVNHLKENRMLTDESGDALMSMMSEDITSITSMKVKDGRGYTPQVRSFALSLHFYSPKAYKYVREKFNKHLPSVSTIKSWYRVVDGSPGFTDESFKAIELRCKEKSGIVNLVLDEMSIKEEIIYGKKEFHGGINFGTIQNTDSAYSDNDNPITAKNALVLMAVSLNENWKIPIGYFLVRSLNAEERASILKLAFELLQKANCKVYSITFDGAASNISGVRFDGQEGDVGDYGKERGEGRAKGKGRGNLQRNKESGEERAKGRSGVLDGEGGKAGLAAQSTPI